MIGYKNGVGSLTGHVSVRYTDYNDIQLTFAQIFL